MVPCESSSWSVVVVFLCPGRCEHTERWQASGRNGKELSDRGGSRFIIYFSFITSSIAYSFFQDLERRDDDEGRNQEWQRTKGTNGPMKTFHGLQPRFICDRNIANNYSTPEQRRIYYVRSTSVLSTRETKRPNEIPPLKSIHIPKFDQDHNFLVVSYLASS